MEKQWIGNTAMNDNDDFQELLARPERSLLAQLTSPAKIQAFLDELAYNHEDSYRCPFRVLRDRKAHCYEGAVFAAAALGHLGYPPLVVNLFPKTRDETMDRIADRLSAMRRIPLLTPSMIAGLYIPEGPDRLAASPCPIVS